MKKLLFTFVLLLNSVTIFANIDERKTDVYFANGIKTLQQTAIDNAGILEDAIINKFGMATYTKTFGKVSYAYNQTANFAADSLETLLQKFGWEWLTNLFIPTHQTDLSEQVTKYENSIKSGHRVLVVAHSQGNLYTYEAYNDLPEWMQEYFEAVTIASPMNADIKPETKRIDWDNDIAARIANLGASDLADLNSSVRKIDWKLDYTQYPAGFVPPPGSKPAGYGYVSELGTIVERDCSTGTRSRTICRFEATEGGVNTNVHAFTFYMGDVLKDGDDVEIINPFTNTTMRDTTAKTMIMAAIENKLTVLEAKPSQWKIESNNETTNVCAERRAELKHFQDAVAPMASVYPFNIATNADGRQIGKVYQPDANRSDEYVLASAEGTQIVDVEGQGVILDDNGNDVGCYQLDGTGDEIKKSCGDVNTTDGVITVDLTWKNPQIDMELSVTKDDAPAGTLELEDIECPREYFYITEADVEEGKYLISVGGPEASGVDADLLPESISINIGAPDGGMNIKIPVADATLLNMGPVAYVLVTKKEGGVSVAVEPTSEFAASGISFTAETYKLVDGQIFEYKTVSLLNREELGPIANAHVQVTPLEGAESGNIVYTGYTSTGDTLETTGLLLLPDSFKQTLSDDSLYLLSATGGEDVDANDDLIRDATPTANYGTIHAVVTGRAVKANGLKLNIMTEIGYQISKELLAYPEKRAEIIARLNDAAGVLFGMDVNGDGVIDHADLHAWVPSFDKPKLRVDYNSKIHPIVRKIYNAEDIYGDAMNLIYPNTRPVADAGEDQSIRFGESVTLDGSGSYDSDGYIANYQWRKWGTIYCSGVTPECVVEGLTAGSHTFELMVTDNNGAVDSDSVEIYVGSEASLVATYDTPGSALDVALSEDGNIAYVADGRYGLQIIDISNPASPTQIGNYDTDGFCEGVTVPSGGAIAYIADGYKGFKIIDITDLRLPTLIGSHGTSGYTYDIAVSSDETVAYVPDTFSGLQIFDIGNPTTPTLTGVYNTPGSAEGVTLSADGAVAYVADYGRGLQIIDIADPAAPSLIGGYATSGSASKVTLSADGAVAYVAEGPEGVLIIDISDPRFETPGSVRSIALSDDGHIAYVADNTGGLQIVDVTAPSSPSAIGSYDTPGYASKVVLSTDGTTAYIADGRSGLQIIDISAFAR